MRVIPYVKRWLEDAGVRVLESWAVPPPDGATLSNGSVAAYRPSCARSWRDGGGGQRALSWQAAGMAGRVRLRAQVPVS